MNNIKIYRAILLFFGGFIGSMIINHTALKPEGWTCCTKFMLLDFITWGLISKIVAIISFIRFDPEKYTNFGYTKD